MNNYQTALITGASSGIGFATAKLLAERGMKIIVLARRHNRLEELKNQLSKPEDCHILACDLQDRTAIQNEINQLPDPFKFVDVLVNSAGLALGLNKAQSTHWEDWETMVETNCMGLAYLTRQILPKMVERNKGHIVNIGSIAANYPYAGGNVYGATKAFVEQFSLNLKADLLGTAVRITNLAPGMVSNSEFSLVRFEGNAEKAEKIYEGITALTPEDIAENVAWVISQPAHVNINRMEIMPTAQAPSRTAYHKENP